ncbi:MAG: thioredoxin [Dehalococcoidia bacterium]|nr:thioredoxin [Dehalococcoidia bacterium]
MSEKVSAITQDSFQKDVVEAKMPVLVDFWAPWCGPCRAVGPVVEELAEAYKNKVGFGKINVDENPVLAANFGVMSIPTLIVFKEGKVAQKLIGYHPKEELQKLLDGILVG